MNLRRFLIYSIPVLVLITVSYLLFFNSSSTPEIYDFLGNFKSASKSGFSESALKNCLPNFSYDEIPEEIKNIIAKKIFINLTNELNFAESRIIKLTLIPDASKASTCEIKLLNGNKKDFFVIHITAGAESEIKIFEIAAQKKREISKFTIDLDLNKKNNLYLVFNNDYLLFLGEDYYYRVIKDKCFLNAANSGSSIYINSLQPDIKAESADLQKNDRQILSKYGEDFSLKYIE